MVVQVLRFANYFEFAFMDPSCNKIIRQDQIYYFLNHFVELFFLFLFSFEIQMNHSFIFEDKHQGSNCFCNSIK